MTIIPTEPIILDPTDAKNGDFLKALYTNYSVLPCFKPLHAEFQNAEDKPFVLTHSMVRIDKPLRRSKNNIFKTKSSCYLVFDPECLGSGCFGAVHPVLGAWKFKDGAWSYKDKTQFKHQKVIKSNYYLNSNLDYKIIRDSYVRERDIGKWTRLGYKYHPVTYDKNTFLLMNRLEGVTLKSIRHKLKKDPNYLSITQRLQITVNLLRELHTQLHGLNIPNKNAFNSVYIVHRDIKDDNIFVDSQFNVTYMDFGLSTYSSDPSMTLGAQIFQDPYLCSHFPNEPDRIPDKNSDLASTARVIAELWGDKSRINIFTSSTLHQYNRSNRLTALFEGIPGLSKDEKKIIRKTISKMTDFNLGNRLSREEALASFEAVLKKRVEQDDQINKTNAIQNPLNKLTKSSLFAVLTSSYAPLLIERLKKDPPLMNRVVPLLKDKFFELKESTMYQLKNEGLDFSKITLSVKSIKKNQYSSTQLELLIKLGAKVAPDALQGWIHKTKVKNQKLRWARICRVLYQNTANGDEIILQVPHKDNLKSIYCHQFLQNKETEHVDETNIRLIKRHLKILKHHREKQMGITKKMDLFFANTPLALALNQSALLNPKTDNLFLSPAIELETIEKGLADLCNLVRSVSQYKDKPTNTDRQKILDDLRLEIASRMNLVKIDWQTAILDTADLKKKVSHFDALDKLDARLQKSSPYQFIAQRLSRELNKHYSKTPSSLVSLSATTYKLEYGFRSIKTVIELKNKMNINYTSFPANSKLEEQFLNLLNKVSLQNSYIFLEEAAQFEQAYRKAEILFNLFKLNTTNFSSAQLPEKYLYQYVQNVYTKEIPNLTVDEIILLFNQLYAFIDNEKNLRQQLAINPELMSFLDVFLKNVIEEKALFTITTLVNLLKTLSYTLNNDQHFLRCITNIAANKHIEDHQRNRVEQILWDYLAGHNTNKEEMMLALAETTQDPNLVQYKTNSRSNSFFSSKISYTVEENPSSCLLL